MLNTDKAAGSRGIPVKFIKLSANVTDSHLPNIINKEIYLNCYSENAKIEDVRHVFKKDERTKVKILKKVKNYQPVIFLNIFSDMYERFINENLTLFVNSFLSEFILAYRKTYSTNHVLIRLIGNCKKI